MQIDYAAFGNTFVNDYFLYVSVIKGSTRVLCSNWYCLELLDFSNFFTIVLSLVGLYFIVDSLDSWKDQDAYYNSRSTLTELKEIIFNCGVASIYHINKYTTPKDHQKINIENREKFKLLLPMNMINDSLDKLESMVNNQPIHCEKDFIELMNEVRKIINKMHRIVDLEKISFHNIGSHINIAIRDDLPLVDQMLENLQSKVSETIK